MKKILSLLLTLSMLLCMVPTAFAAGDDRATEAADALYELGLFKGAGYNPDGTPIYALDYPLDRASGIVMLVRMLGKEEEAMAGTWENSFTDVPDWAAPHVGYAHANGLVNGYNASTFGSSARMNATQYITLMLRVLGFKSGRDFEYDKAWELSDQIGLTHGEYDEKNSDDFLRGDVAILSYSTYKRQEILATAPYYGLPADIEWYCSPRTLERLDSNILYSFLVGNYSLNFKNIEGFYDSTDSNENTILRLIPNRIKWLSITYPELVGVYSNAEIEVNSNYPTSLSINFPLASLTTDEVYAHQLAALQRAQEISADLHQRGKITDGMSEKEIAQVYYDYLWRDLGKGSPITGGSSAEIERGKSVEYDSAYACLVNRKADCVGRAAAFNLLMRVEGISAQGIGGHFKSVGGGHVLNKVILDGEVYYCDWGNHRPLSEDISSWFEFDDPSQFEVEIE